MSKFKVGDRVRRKDGTKISFSDTFIVTVTYVSVSDFTRVGCCGRSIPLLDEGMYELAYPNPPNKHAELIKAWADGAVIECYSQVAGWRFIETPSWYKYALYRIAKPKPTANEVEKESILAELAKLQKRLDSLEV